MAERVQQFHRLVASASCRGILKAARAQMVALLDLFTQYGACQSIEFFALFELQQNPGQQLLEYRNRAVTGQNLGIGNRRLDELADKLTKDCLADRALALAVRGGDRANSGESTALSLTGTVAVSPATPWGERDSGRSSYARSMRRLSMPDDLAFPRALHLR
jgi:hypothetical protein